MARVRSLLRRADNAVQDKTPDVLVLSVRDSKTVAVNNRGDILYWAAQLIFFY